MTQTDTQIADLLQATVEGTAPKMRGAFGDLRTTTAIERRADQLNDLIAQLAEPVAITPAARAAYQLITAHDHEFDSDDDGDDIRPLAQQYLSDAESDAYAYEQAYREARRDNYWSADEAADLANDESGLAAATARAHDAILLLAAALRTAPGPDDDPSDDRAETEQPSSPTAAELNAAADAVWQAAITSPRSRRPLRHKSARELYAATCAVFRALPDDDRISSIIHTSSAPDLMFGGDALADLTTADMVFDPATENYEGDTVAEWRERGADAIAAIVAILRQAAEAAPSPEDDDPSPSPSDDRADTETDTETDTARLVAEAMQPANARKPIYDLRLTNPPAIRSAAKRASAAAEVIDRIETDNPREAAAVEQLREYLYELEYAAELLSPDEFGGYDGDPYSAAAHAQSDIEGQAAQLIAGVAPIAQMVPARQAIEAAGLDWMDFYRADSARPVDARQLEAIGGVYYIDPANIPSPDDDDPEPTPPAPSQPRLELEQTDADTRHSWQPSTERSECAECSAPLSARNWCSACRAVCWRCADDLTEHWTDGRGDALHTAHARARAVAAGWLSSEQRQRSPSYTRPRIAWTMHPVPSTTDDPEDDPPPSSPRPRRQTVREQAPSAEQWQAIVEARGCSTDADAPRCPECGSADIGRGSITGDPFCRECRSSAIAGADGVWAGVGRQLRRMAAAADANRAARIAAVAPIEAEAVALDDDAPPVWQPNPPQQQQAKPTAPSDDRPARLQQAADDIARTSPETAAVLLELADTDPAERVEAVHYRTTRAAAPLDGWIVSCGRVAADTDSSADPDAVSCAGCILVLDAAEQLPPRLELVAARIERDTALDDFRAVNAPYVARRDRDEAIDPSEQAAVVNPARERWQAAIRRVEAARVAAAEQRAAPGPSRAQANAAVKATDARMQAEAEYRRARLVDDLDQDAQPRYPEDLTPTQQRRADASDRLWSARDREAGAARRLHRQRRAAAQQ